MTAPTREQRIINLLASNPGQSTVEIIHALSVHGINRASVQNAAYKNGFICSRRGANYVYSLPDSMAVKFSAVAIVQPACVNVFGKPMTGYEKAMRRGIRADGVCTLRSLFA
jgi:hypothetical protein